MTRLICVVHDIYNSPHQCHTWLESCMTHMTHDATHDSTHVSYMTVVIYDTYVCRCMTHVCVESYIVTRDATHDSTHMCQTRLESRAICVIQYISLESWVMPTYDSFKWDWVLYIYSTRKLLRPVPGRMSRAIRDCSGSRVMSTYDSFECSIVYGHDSLRMSRDMNRHTYIHASCPTHRLRHTHSNIQMFDCVWTWLIPNDSRHDSMCTHSNVYDMTHVHIKSYHESFGMSHVHRQSNIWIFTHSNVYDMTQNEDMTHVCTCDEASHLCMTWLETRDMTLYTFECVWHDSKWVISSHCEWLMTWLVTRTYMSHVPHTTRSIVYGRDPLRMVRDMTRHTYIHD